MPVVNSYILYLTFYLHGGGGEGCKNWLLPFTDICSYDKSKLRKEVSVCF